MRIRGELVYAKAQTFGRTGAMASNLLKDIALLGSQEARLDRATKFALSFWHDFLLDPVPRTVPLSPHRRPLVIFTDGCCMEKDGEIFAGFGGVMIDPEDGAYEFFQGKVEGEFRSILTHGGEKAQIVGQAEMIPCVISRILWADRLRHRCCLHYIDNEAARCGLIRGYSPVKDNAFLNQLFWAEECRGMAFSWFDRVPSPSNIADPPSRGEAPPCLTLGARTHQCKEVAVPPGTQEAWVVKWREYASL
jgi:hypothetical protein